MACIQCQTAPLEEAAQCWDCGMKDALAPRITALRAENEALRKALAAVTDEYAELLKSQPYPASKSRGIQEARTALAPEPKTEEKT